MFALRTEVLIPEVATGRAVPARFVPLTAALAKSELNARWWRSPPGNAEGQNEEDATWNWEDLYADASKKDFWECVGLQTPDNRLQGAIIYSADAKSALERNAGAIYVDNLATAPWNRKQVTNSPKYAAVGSELLLQAVHHSHLLGLRGRVILASLPGAMPFYNTRGFIDTGTKLEGWPLLELAPDQARNWLLKKELVKHAQGTESDE